MEAIAKNAAHAKKKKNKTYRAITEELHGSFTPLAFSANGALHGEN